MDANKRFAELAGICWHEQRMAPIVDGEALCSCGFLFDRRDIIKHIKKSNPDFSDPIAVLRVVMEREDWPEFSIYLWNHFEWPTRDSYTTTVMERSILLDYLLTPGLLRDEAIKWMEAHHDS